MSHLFQILSSIQKINVDCLTVFLFLRFLSLFYVQIRNRPLRRMGYFTIDDEMDEEKGLRRMCLECGSPLPPGRSDMKFCCVRCKSRWNYRSSGFSNGFKLKVLNAINRNYSILASLLEDGIVSIDIPDLSARGFDFDCVTSYHKVRCHHEYRIYDIKYFKSDSRVFCICRGERPKTKGDK